MTGKQIGLIFGVLAVAAAVAVGAKYVFPGKPKPAPDGSGSLPYGDSSTNTGTTPPSNSPRTENTNPRPNVSSPTPPTPPPPPAEPTPAPPVTVNGFSKGTKVWVNKNAVILYTYPASGADKMLRATKMNVWGFPEQFIPQFNLSVTPLGTFEEAATAGWAKIVVKNLQTGGIAPITGYAFVPMKDIKNTAY